MNVQDDYLQQIALLREIRPYNRWAIEMAISGFRNLLDEDTERFIALGKEAYKDNKAFDHIAENIQKIKEAGSIDKRHEQIILSLMPAFLPTEQQFELILWEILDNLQARKLSLTNQGKARPDVQGAFDIYSKYLANLYNLSHVSSKWFSERAYAPYDRQEVLNAVEFLQTAKIQSSIKHFKSDLEMMQNRLNSYSSKAVYFIDFLGIEVSVGEQNDLNTFNRFDETPFPQFGGKFADLLQNYLLENLSVEEKQQSLQKMHEAVLAHDLGIALAHYKQNNTLSNRADIQFALRGGAGIVHLKIRSWLNRLLIGDFTILERGLFALPFWAISYFVIKRLTAGDYLLAYMSDAIWVVFCVFVGLLAYSLPYMKRLFRRKADNNIAKNTTESLASYMLEQYEQMVKDKRHVFKIYQPHQKNNEACDSIHLHLLALLRKRNIFDLFQRQDRESPEFCQALFGKYQTGLLEYSEEKKIENIVDLDSFRAYQYVLDVRYAYIREKYNELITMLLASGSSFQIFVAFLEADVRVDNSFYQKIEDTQSNVVTLLPSPYDLYKLRRRSFIPQLKVPYPSFGSGIAEKLKQWIAEEINALTQIDFENDLLQIQRLLNELDRSKTTAHLLPQPFVYDCAFFSMYVS